VKTAAIFNLAFQT